MRASSLHEAPRRGPGEPDSARRAATRERLVDAAYDVFAEVGLYAATVEQVAERAGFTRGAFYSNFDTKEELFFELMDRETGTRLDGLAARLDAMRPHLGGELDEEQLAELLLDILCWAMSDQRWTTLMEEFRLMAMRERRLAVDYLARRDEMVASVRRIVDRALDGTGREFSVDPDLAVRLLINTYIDSVRDNVLAGVPEGDSASLRLTLARVVLAVTRQHGAGQTQG